MEDKSISSSAMLVDLRISVWTARKLDRATQAEVVQAKNAKSARAASVNKHLLADAEQLMAISRFSSDCRQWLYANTLPWSDSGARLLPTLSFFTFKQELSSRETHFWSLVKTFEQEYPALITAMAMQLGALFKREEYPDPARITEKFDFVPTFSPVPESGDFRVDLPADALRELKQTYAREADTRVELAMRDAWQRLHDTLKHMHERLEPPKEGEKAKRIYETLLTNASELCDVLTSLNILGDPKLEEARRALDSVIKRTNTQSLREVPEQRDAVRARIAEIMDKMGG